MSCWTDHWTCIVMMIHNGSFWNIRQCFQKIAEMHYLENKLGKRWLVHGWPYKDSGNPGPGSFYYLKDFFHPLGSRHNSMNFVFGQCSTISVQKRALGSMMTSYGFYISAYVLYLRSEFLACVNI